MNPGIGPRPATKPISPITTIVAANPTTSIISTLAAFHIIIATPINIIGSAAKDIAMAPFLINLANIPNIPKTIPTINIDPATSNTIPIVTIAENKGNINAHNSIAKDAVQITGIEEDWALQLGTLDNENLIGKQFHKKEDFVIIHQYDRVPEINEYVTKLLS